MSLEPFDPDAPANADSLFGLPHTPENAAAVVIPVPFEATASYRRGTSGAPNAILLASAQVDLTDTETGEPWRAGIAMEEVDPRIEAWNTSASNDALTVIAAGGLDPSAPALAAAVHRVNSTMEALNDVVYARTRSVLERGRIPAILGGDHSVPFGAILAAAERHPGLGILHIDAHADLRVAYEGFTWSHASILYNVATRVPGVGTIVQVGVRDICGAERRFSASDSRFHSWYHTHVAWTLAGGKPWLEVVREMIAPLPREIWVTFDIDGLDPTLCPHTGTPVPGGLSWSEALVLLRALAESGRRIVGFDLVEVTPQTDDEWDAIVGARLLYKLAGWAIR